MGLNHPLRGSCYGFGVRSELKFNFLREGNGVPLRVDLHDETEPGSDEELLVEWKPRPNRPFHGRVYQQPQSGRLRIWTSDAGWYLVDPENHTISIPSTVERVAREARLWTTPMLLTLAVLGAVPLHAAAVEVEGKALLFGAPSQFGKTSLAAAFAARGHRLLAEDVTCITLDGGELQVVPGPSLLRLRPDVAALLNIPGTRLVAARPDRVFLTFENQLRGSSRPVPLEAILLLRGASDKVRLEPAKGPKVLADLWALAFRLPTDADTTRAFDGVTRLAAGKRVWNLQRPWDMAKLESTVDDILEALGA